MFFCWMKTCPHVDGRDPFHQLRLKWYISYCFTSFCTSHRGARCCLWKTTPRRNFQSHRPRFPNPPLVQVRRHISELLTKAKADFREHFGTQLGFLGLGAGRHLQKSMGNPWFGFKVWMLWFYRLRRGIWHCSKLQMFGIGSTEESYHVSDILCQ